MNAYNRLKKQRKAKRTAPNQNSVKLKQAKYKAPNVNGFDRDFASREKQRRNSRALCAFVDIRKVARIEMIENDLIQSGHEVVSGIENSVIAIKCSIEQRDGMVIIHVVEVN